MNFYSNYNPDPEIIWIKDLDQLDQPYQYTESYIKFVFAKYEIYDKTHDKLVKRTASIKKAEEKKARHLLYKKHAKCDVQIVENDLQSTLDLDLANVYGTDASHKRKSKINDDFYGHSTSEDGLQTVNDTRYERTTRKYVLVDRNINMELKVAGIEVDKFIITKSDKQMRLTVLKIEDRFGNTSTITLFDNDIVDKMGDQKFVKIKNAEVNMRKHTYSDSDKIEFFPEGLKIPHWATIEPISGFSQREEPVVAGFSVSEEAKIEEVRCEQIHCSGRGKDTQFYCVKCNKELCSICIFEHKKDTSISGLECDNEICYGSREQNVGVITN